MTSHREAPFYEKLSLILISSALIAVGLIYGKDIILPILFAILLANLLLPIVNKLSSKRLSRPVSILLPLILSIVIGVGILYLLTHQVMKFVDDVPALKERMDEVSHSAQVWFRKSTDITIRKQNQYIRDTVEDLKEKTPQLVGVTFTSLTTFLTYVVLLPIYTFLILYYRKTIKSFLIQVFKNGSEEKVRDILTESTAIAQKYISGLSIETTIVFALNSIGFLILGIKYAIFLALLAALLNLIPYVGMLVASILCMVITLASSDSTSTVIWVGVVLLIVQILDNQFGMPLIVGNKVRINALATIIGVLLGGALCGFPGMFLAIPGLAVLKVICDRVPELKAWGMLMGDDTEGGGKIFKIEPHGSKPKAVNE